MWKIVRAILLDRRLVSAGFLLLAVVLLDSLFLRPIVLELDILEHFLFGFVLSEIASKTANLAALDELLSRRAGHKDSQRMNLPIRFIGFLRVGALGCFAAWYLANPRLCHARGFLQLSRKKFQQRRSS